MADNKKAHHATLLFLVMTYLLIIILLEMEGMEVLKTVKVKIRVKALKKITKKSRKFDLSQADIRMSARTSDLVNDPTYTR